MSSAAAAYARQLTPGARSYLLEERGLDDAAIASAHLGYVGDPHPGHERFQGMLSIPYLAPAGVVSLKFRRREGRPKYDAPSGQKPRLYNVTALHTREPHVVVCEGELDALVMHRMVGIPAVGVPGTATWAEHHPRCFADFEKVFVVCDNDDKDDGSNPGQVFASRIAKTLPQATVVQPPPGLDVNEWYAKEGAAAIRERVLR